MQTFTLTNQEQDRQTLNASNEFLQLHPDTTLISWQAAHYSMSTICSYSLTEDLKK